MASVKKLDIFVSLLVVAFLFALHGDQPIIDVVHCCHIINIFIFFLGYFGSQLVDFVLTFILVHRIIRFSIHVLAFWS